MLIPRSFTILNTIDTSVKIFSLLLTAFIFYKAYRLYKLYGDRSLLYFMATFFFFSVGYMFSALIDIFMYLGLLTPFNFIISLKTIVMTLLAAHFGSLLMAFMFLLFIALGFPQRKIQLVIFFLVILGGVLISFKSLYFFLIVTLFMAFILLDLISKFMKGKVKLVYLIGMITLYIAYISYVLALLSLRFYWIGHALEIISYSLFLISLMLVLKKNETKTRKA